MTFDDSDAPNGDALDLDADGMTLDELGRELGISREGARAVVRKALHRFARAASLGGVIDRLPSFYERPVTHVSKRSPTPPAPADEDDEDDDDLDGMRRPYVSFFDRRATGKQVCTSVDLMLRKRRAVPGPPHHESVPPRSSLGAVLGKSSERESTGVGSTLAGKSSGQGDLSRRTGETAAIGEDLPSGARSGEMLDRAPDMGTEIDDE